MKIPYLKNVGSTRQLIVDGKPFLILGGELGNSSASDLDYLKNLWPKLGSEGLNTVLLPVEWDQIEPKEGQYDFAVLDGIIRQANEHNQRIILLWFGAWKNSMSTYAPSWVKRDETRFPRSRDESGRAQDILSCFGKETLEVETKTFRALMRHIGKSDRSQRVLMVQVENEIGMLPSARDHSASANAALRQTPVATDGTPAGDEQFQAWGYAHYVEQLAKAGKQEYALPMFVNAALNRPGALPGQYPSAGPLPHLFKIWNKFAPSIDLLSPDSYWPDFVPWAKKYSVQGNSLFVPELNRAGKPEAAANALFAIGELGAIGVSPFSIENIPVADPLSKCYAMLSSMAPLITANQGKGSIRGIKASVDFEGNIDMTPSQMSLGGFEIKATVVDPWTPKDKQDYASHGALIISMGKGEFYVAGIGITFEFPENDGDQTGIDQVVEGSFRNGGFVEGRWLNGDETHQGRHVRLPPDKFSIQRVRLYKFR